MRRYNRKQSAMITSSYPTNMAISLLAPIIRIEVCLSLKLPIISHFAHK